MPATTFRIKDLLIAVSPVIDKDLTKGGGAFDDCTRCTGLTGACPGCSRIQCSNFPTNNFGFDFTIYEAVAHFKEAELLLLKADMKMAQQRQAQGAAKKTPMTKKMLLAEEMANLESLEEKLKEALAEVASAKAKLAVG